MKTNIYESKTKAQPYQADAIKFIVERENVPLFDEQGLGKSKMIIDALCHEMKQKKIKGAIIICNKTLAFNWEDEIKKHSNLDSTTILGGPGQRTIGMFVPADFYIINYEAVIVELERLLDLMRWKKMAVVLDESDKIKNPYSKVSQAIFQLRSFAIKRIIATGTPVANRPEDLWSQFYFLDGGTLLGNDFKEYLKKYKIGSKDDPTEKQEVFRELRDLIYSVSMRRLKDQVLELPEKGFFSKYVVLTKAQKRMYDQVKNELYIEIKNKNDETVIDENEAILKKLLRLLQIASNPRLIDMNYKESPAKFLLLDKIVSDIISNKEKLIIWTNFVDNIKVLKIRYEKFNAVTLFGEQPIQERRKVVEKFQNDVEVKVLIANPAAAKAGLTLTAANNAIYLDRNFKLNDYLQSQDRIHRFGQTKKCRIIMIIAKGTIDEYIDHVLDTKHAVARYVQSDSPTIERKTKGLTKEEILQMLS